MSATVADLLALLFSWGPCAACPEDIDGDGESELITGKRVRAHSGKDAGGLEDPVVIYYDWNKEALKFTKHEVHRGQAGIGLQIRIADMNGDGLLDSGDIGAFVDAYLAPC